MFDKKKILSFLEGEGMEEVDEIEYTDSILVYNFFYVFDAAELDAAKEFANENYDEAEGENAWYDEYFLPYLTDVSADNVKDILEDLCAECELEGEFIAYELDRDSYDKCEYTIILAKEGTDFDVDKVLDDLDL